MEVVGPNAAGHRRLRRRRAARPARALLPLVAGDDLRRRHQRDPARHHRLRRPRPAAQRSAERDARHGLHLTPEQDRGRRAGRADPRATTAPPSGCKAVEAEGDALRRASCGRSSATPGCSAWPCPRSTAAPGSACSSCAACWSRSAARSRPCRSPRTPSPALALAELGTDEQKHAWLRGAATGERVLTAAVAEDRAYAPERADHRRRPPTGDGWRLTGSKAIVPAGTGGRRCSSCRPRRPSGVGGLPGRSPDDAGRDRHDAAVHRRRRGRPARPRRRRGSAPTAWSAPPTARSRAGSRTCSRCAGRAEQLGICEGALALTATYAKTREQFGRPIGTFQAVSQRLADGYIDALGPAADALAGRLAARRGAAGRQRGRDREAVGRRRRPPDRAHDRARPRRRRHRPRRRGAPLLHRRPSATSSCTAAPPSRRCTSAGSWPPSPPERRR